MPSKEFRKKQQRYPELFHAAPLALVATDPYGIVDELNKAAVSLFHRSPEEIEGKPLAEFFSEIDRRPFSEALRGVRQGGTRELESREVTLERPGNPPCAVALSLALIREKPADPAWLCWTLIDLTPLKQAEESLKEAVAAMLALKREITQSERSAAERTAELTDLSGRATELDVQLRGATADLAKAIAERKQTEDRYRLLAARVQTIAEEQSTRIACQVHDELGQMITGLKMDVVWLSKRLPVEFREKLSSMSGILDEAVDTVRRIALELRPALLDELGLSAALEWLLEQLQERTGLSCRFTVFLNDKLLGKRESTALFRIFQEAVSNISRHAEATSVEVALFEESGKAVLKVQDNGHGMREVLNAEPRSLGLLGMQERAQLVGGELAIESSGRDGVVVTARVPLRTENR